MSGVIKTQQKAHLETVCAIDCSMLKFSRPTDATESSFYVRSAKVLEDVEQLQGEGKRLAQQVSPYDPSRCPLVQLHFDVAHSITDGTTSRNQSRRSR